MAAGWFLSNGGSGFDTQFLILDQRLMPPTPASKRVPGE